MSKPRLSTKRLKGRAKAASKEKGTSHASEVNRLVDLYDVSLRAEDKLVLSRDNLYAKDIGGIHWVVKVLEGDCGPTLWAQCPDDTEPKLACSFGLPARLSPPNFRTSRVGSKQFCWAVGMYEYAVMDLPSFTDADAHELSECFGLFIPPEKNYLSGSQCSYRMSEALFLKSPTFAAIRQAVREGILKPASAREWTRYLSPTWTVLAAMSDGAFAKYGKKIADVAMFKFFANNPPQEVEYWYRLMDLVESEWQESLSSSPDVVKTIDAVIPMLVNRYARLTDERIKTLPLALPQSRFYLTGTANKALDGI